MRCSFLELCLALGTATYLASSHEIKIEGKENIRIEVIGSQGNDLEKIDVVREVDEEIDDERMEGGGDDEVFQNGELTDENSLVRLSAVNTLDDFLSLLHKENGEKITPDDIFSKYESEDGKRVMHTGGRLAVPDECSPRNTTVYLRMNSTDSREVFFPRCTRVERCGGCCPTPHLKCVSAYTERISLMVVKAKASRPGSPHLVFNGIAPVVVDRHIRCQVRCMLSDAKCGRKKKFLANRCVCKCRRYLRCIAPQMFNPDTCECECPGGPKECCRSRQTCPYVFNTRSCECEVYNGKAPMKDRNFTTDETDPEMEGRLLRVHISNKDSSLSTKLSTTTTAAAAVAATTAPDTSQQLLVPSKSNPCAGVKCPRMFRYNVYDDKCHCRPTGRFRRPKMKSKPKARGKRKWRLRSGGDDW